MPIKTGHHASHYIAGMAGEEHHRRWVSEGEFKIALWIVPWSRQTGQLPKRDNFIAINGSGWVDGYSHSIVPGGFEV